MSPTTATEPRPKLRHGERLDREEFHRRYENMPDVKAELIDGVVYIMSSPVSPRHASPHFSFITWLGNYVVTTPGVDGSDNGTVWISENSEVQPDAFLSILESHGGQSHIVEDKYVCGAPELVGEIAVSSVGYDRNIKRAIYQRVGVREFILWKVADQTIEWLVLRGSDYEPLPVGPDGIIRSETFPGLWLDVEAMVRRDGGTFLRVLQQGISSAQHVQFVEALEKRRKARTN